MGIFNSIFGGNSSVTTITNSKNSIIRINGKTYTGNNVQVVGNKVMIDGVDQTPDSLNINIEIQGDVSKLVSSVANSITVNGNVGELESDTGDVKVIGNISGNVKSDVGNIRVEGNVSGNVKTDVGNIKYNK